jgi:carboxypeptidase C (cathepsin A)
MRKTYFQCLFALFIGLTALAPAAEEAKDDKDKKEKKETKDDTVVTEHSLPNGLKYKATAGTTTLTKAYGEPRAGIFSVSYERTESDAKAPRPVCFCFNGGPGSSAVWLHLGAFGPRRVVLPEGGITAPQPPFALTDNEFTLLAETDLVFVDPVSTGLSRPEKGEDAKQFHGFQEDVESVSDFIRLWITKRNRWSSPKYLMGESYGAIRVSGLAEHLQSRYGMYLNGVIIVSGLLDFKTLSPSPQNDVPYLIWFPSMVAAAHHHGKLAPELQQDFPSLWKRAVNFSRTTYASALHLSGAMTAEAKQAIAAEMSALTSLPTDYILRENLRIDPSAFRSKLRESHDEVIGRFDARCIGADGDPSYDVVYGAFATSMNHYLRDPAGLNYVTDQPYEILNGKVNPWNYGGANRYFDVCENLTSAMTANPALRVLITCGYHDLATPPEGIEHSVRHMDLAANLRKNITFTYYDGGHMMYTNLPSLAKLSADVVGFVKQPANP